MTPRLMSKGGRENWPDSRSGSRLEPKVRDGIDGKGSSQFEHVGVISGSLQLMQAAVLLVSHTVFHKGTWMFMSTMMPPLEKVTS